MQGENKMEYNRVKVTICGKDYLIQTTEKDNYLTNLAKMLEQKITKLTDANDTTTISTASILVSLDLLDESYKSSADMDNIRNQISSYVEEANKARMELDKLYREVRDRDSEIEKLKTDIKLLTLKESL